MRPPGTSGAAAKGAPPHHAVIAYNDFSISGGAQRQALMLALELQPLGYETRCVAFKSDSTRCYPDLMARVEHQALPPDFRPAIGHYLSAPFCATNRYHRRLEECRALADRILARPADVVNLHDFQTFEIAAFIPPGPAVVWMLNDVHEIERLQRDRRSIRRFLGRGQAWISPRRRLGHLRMRALARIDRIVVLDSRNRARVSEAFGRTADIIRSGVVLVPPPPDRSLPPAGGILRLMSVGILSPHRRFEDLLRAVDLMRKKNHPVSLKLVGRSDTAPDYAQQLRRLVAELNLSDCVEFIDSLSDADLDAAYRTAHIFVFPHAPQTWGLSPFEAMVRGTPVVLTRGCGASEVLEDGVNALITEAHQPEQLANAIGSLTSNPDLWQRIRANGLEFVHQNISWERYAMQMHQVFREEQRLT